MGSSRRVPRPPRPKRAAIRTKQPEDDAKAARVTHEAPAEVGEAREVGESTSETAAQQRFPCAQCGAKLVYKPGTATLTCQHCGHANPIPQSQADIKELDFRSVLAQLAEGHETEEHTTIKCGACGAEIDKPGDLTALPCPYCGADIVATAKSTKRIKPKSLLPFKIERDEARARFKNWLRKLWFAPNDVKKYARPDRLAGMYVPYWTYDSDTKTAYSGMRGVYYYVTVGSGKNRRTVRRTRWYPASGVVFNSFNDILVLASESLPRKHADKLEPWGLRDLVPYSDEYLSGFQSESYQVDLIAGFVRAREIMEGPIRDSVRYDIGGDVQQIHSLSTQYDQITFKHILLPIWISSFRFKQKIYRFLVNGRTGEVQGERPWSWIKITLAVVVGLAAVGGIVWALRASGVLDF